MENLESIQYWASTAFWTLLLLCLRSLRGSEAVGACTKWSVPVPSW